jgi:hypothetical protein
MQLPPTKCLLNGAVTCYSKCYLRSTLCVRDRTRLRNRTTAQTQTLWATCFVLVGPHFIDSFSPDVYVRTSLTGRSQHVVERLTQDYIGTHFVERDVGQQPITISLRQAGRTCGLQSWWLFSSFSTWEMTQVLTSRPDANFSVIANALKRFFLLPTTNKWSCFLDRCDRRRVF